MKPKIRAVYFPPRIFSTGNEASSSVEICGGYEAIVVNVQEVECAAVGSLLRHETAEEAIQDLLKANGWDRNQCITEIIHL